MPPSPDLPLPRCQDGDPGLRSPDAIQEFLIMMAVCHTVIPEEQERSTGTIVYHAASPGS